jgi:hypothetical protein
MSVTGCVVRTEHGLAFIYPGQKGTLLVNAHFYEA